MNQLQAMRDTVALMDSKLSTLGVPLTHLNLDDSLQPEHIRGMLAAMEAGVNPQDPARGFSEGKAGRWLGWAQAAIVAMQHATLEDMKEINRRNSDSAALEDLDVTGILRNASRLTPEQDHRGHCLRGQVFGDKRGRFFDGEWVITSTIMEEKANDVFVTRFSTYRVESWAS